MIFDRDADGETPTRLPLWAHIAVGVALGVLISSAVQWWIVGQYAQHVLERAASEFRQSTEAAEARATADRLMAQTDAAAQARHLAGQQRAVEAEKTAVAVEVERREQAWRNFYRPSAGCVGSSSTVQCANEYVRFKREFAAKYQGSRP